MEGSKQLLCFWLEYVFFDFGLGLMLLVNGRKDIIETGYARRNRHLVLVVSAVNFSRASNQLTVVEAVDISFVQHGHQQMGLDETGDVEGSSPNLRCRSEISSPSVAIV